jgi:hypothetical protein
MLLFSLTVFVRQTRTSLRELLPSREDFAKLKVLITGKQVK